MNLVITSNLVISLILVMDCSMGIYHVIDQMWPQARTCVCVGV